MTKVPLPMKHNMQCRNLFGQCKSLKIHSYFKTYVVQKTNLQYPSDRKKFVETISENKQILMLQDSDFHNNYSIYKFNIDLRISLNKSNKWMVFQNSTNPKVDVLEKAFQAWPSNTPFNSIPSCKYKECFLQREGGNPELQGHYKVLIAIKTNAINKFLE